jgi:hypothetical protein
MLNRAIVSPFGIVREIACRQLAVAAVVHYTFATNAFAGARFVSAVTICSISFFFTFHISKIQKFPKFKYTY